MWWATPLKYARCSCHPTLPHLVIQLQVFPDILIEGPQIRGRGKAEGCNRPFLLFKDCMR